MIILYILLSCFVSTSLMTLFSYASSRIFVKQFREPELLNSVATHLHILPRPVSNNHPAGWIAHYGVGLLFITLIEGCRYLMGLSVSMIYYIVCGVICGLIGIFTWFLTFSADPKPPKIDYKGFYVQLLAAHIVFGLGAYLIAVMFLITIE